MNVRNRSNSRSAKRRSGGMGLLFQGMLFLFMIAFCFLMGFFVLSRYVGGGRGPDSASPVASNGSEGDVAALTKPKRLASPASAGVSAARRRRAAPQQEARPADTPGPSIEPADESPTQKPSSIDDESSHTSQASTDAADKSDTNRSASDTGSGDRSAVQEPGNTLTADNGQTASDAPPPRRRHHRRRRTHTAPADSKSADEQKSGSQGDTQAPRKLDDSSDAGGKGGNGDGDN